MSQKVAQVTKQIKYLKTKDMMHFKRKACGNMPTLHAVCNMSWPHACTKFGIKVILCTRKKSTVNAVPSNTKYSEMQTTFNLR